MNYHTFGQAAKIVLSIMRGSDPKSFPHEEYAKGRFRYSPPDGSVAAVDFNGGSPVLLSLRWGRTEGIADGRQ